MQKTNNVALNNTQLRSLHLFAGAGGGILADMLLGHKVVGAVEIEEYPRKVLLQRQRDRILPRFPIWDDVCTFSGLPWRGAIDVICGGFPCQDISAAGKGEGITGARSGLWKEYARIIDEVRPEFVFAENSPLLRTRGLATVLKDLTQMGYDVRWGVLGGWHSGAPHKRDRMWVLAHSTGSGFKQSHKKMERGSSEQFDCSDIQSGKMADSCDKGLQGGACSEITCEKRRKKSDGYTSQRGGLWWDDDPAISGVGPGELQGDPECQSELGRVAYGVADRVDRLRAIGNGQIPAVARLAWQTLSAGWV